MSLIDKRIETAQELRKMAVVEPNGLQAMCLMVHGFALEKEVRQEVQQMIDQRTWGILPRSLG